MSVSKIRAGNHFVCTGFISPLNMKGEVPCLQTRIAFYLTVWSMLSRFRQVGCIIPGLEEIVCVSV
jgi:hypothetical protein